MQVEIRKLNIDDYDELAEAMKKAYPEAEALFACVRPIKDTNDVRAALHAFRP